MAISIPAILDAQLLALRTGMMPVQDAVTKTQSYSSSPHAMGNRVAEILRMLTNLIDSGTLTEDGGGGTVFTDGTAFTGVNSLVGCTFTFAAATTTAALRDVVRTVASNTVNALTFTEALPASTANGDTGVLTWDKIDKDLAVLEGNKGFGDTQSNPYSSGPSMINALSVLVEQLGGSVPASLGSAAAEPFGVGSPHAGGGSSYGHAGNTIMAGLLQLARDTVAAYTAPA